MFNNISCPSCEEPYAILQQCKLSLPDVGRVLKNYMFCSNCFYTDTSFVSLSRVRSAFVKFPITSVDDLNAKVIKGDNCSVRIPELGVKLDSGMLSSGFSSVRRVLSDIKSVLKYDYGCTPVIHQINRIRRGKLQATLILEDPSGVSTIIPKKVKRY